MTELTIHLSFFGAGVVAGILFLLGYAVGRPRKQKKPPERRGPARPPWDATVESSPGYGPVWEEVVEARNGRLKGACDEC